MTNPDSTALNAAEADVVSATTVLGQVTSAYEQAVAAGATDLANQLQQAQSALTAAQANLATETSKEQADQTVITTANATIATQTANIANLTAQIAALKNQAPTTTVTKAIPTTIFGARCGPNTPGGPVGAAEQTRVYTLLGGKLGVERLYNIGGTRWALPNSTAYNIMLSTDADAAGTIAGTYDAQHTAIFKACSKYQTVWYSPCVQEVDINGVTPAQAVALVDHVKKLAAPYPNIKVGVIVTSYQAYVGTNLAAYFSANSDYVAMDCYQNYGMPGKLGTLVMALGYGVALAKQLNKPLIVPEISIRTNPNGSTTDAVHSQMVSDAVAYSVSNGIVALSWFDSNKAGQSANESDWRLEPFPTSTAIWKTANIVSNGVLAKS